jgi:hypothetical protein
MANRTRMLCLGMMITAAWVTTALTLLLVLAAPVQGKYFAKKRYHPQPLPTFAETRGKLPAPICEEDALLVQAYWKTLELGFRNL